MTFANLKTSTSRWLKTQSTRLSDFAWQSGYGEFSVSRSNIDEVRAYIVNQREHHRMTTFQDEFLAFLERHDVDYDARYVWD
ncbi:MAG: transposase [Phycisphaeraceae bacterium]|nr:transposase [Phycisphaeraceae bacterium]